MKRNGNASERNGPPGLLSSGQESKMRLSTRGNVVLLLVLQFLVIISLPLFLPKKKSTAMISPTPRSPGNSTRCFPTLCDECSAFEMRRLDVCKLTGFHQRIVCSQSSPANFFGFPLGTTLPSFRATSRPTTTRMNSCVPPFRGPEGAFLPFVLVTSLVGFLSHCVVRFRFRKLQEVTERRIQNQLTSIV